MSVQAELAREVHPLPLTRLCRWMGVPRRSVCYQRTTRRSAINPNKASQVRTVIVRFPIHGYRRIAVVLGWNEKAV